MQHAAIANVRSHYVAFIHKDPGWVLFNDEKVALGGDVKEMKKFAYIYFFRREGK